MLKKISKAVWKVLLKCNWFNREVRAYKAEMIKQRIESQKQRKRDDWAQLMQSGGTVRDYGKDDYRTMATVDDAGIVVDYMDGRKVCGEHVVPVYIDSLTWGNFK